MQKFFLCNINYFDGIEPTMVTPNDLIEQDGRMMFDYGAESSNAPALENAYLFTEDSLKEMNIDVDESMIKIPVTQSFIDQCPYTLTDTAPQVKADQTIPQYPDSTEVILISPTGFCTLSDFGDSKSIDPNRGYIPSHCTGKEISDRKLDGQLEQQGVLKVKWDPEGYHRTKALEWSDDRADIFNRLATERFGEDLPEYPYEKSAREEREAYVGKDTRTETAKFFLYDKAQKTMITPDMFVEEESGQMAVNPNPVATIADKHSPSLDGAVLFTFETAKEISNLPNSAVPIYVTQDFLDNIPYPIYDLDPQHIAWDQTPKTENAKDTVALICPLGVIAVDEERRTFDIKSPDMTLATPITNQRISELGLEDQLKEVGALKVEWNPGRERYRDAIDLQQSVDSLSDEMSQENTI